MIHFLSLCDSKSYEEGKTRFLQKSFEKYNIKDENNTFKYQLTIIKNYVQNQGKYNKIIQVYNYLRSKEGNSIKDNDVIIFVDGFDTIVMKKMDEDLENDFRNSGKDIIFGADHHFEYIYPDALQYYNDRYKNNGLKYLNSSFYIGYKSSILQFFQYIMSHLIYYPKPDKIISDRRVIGYVFYQAHSKDHSSTNKALQHLRLDLDTSGKYFYSKNKDKNINELLVRNPYFVHFRHLGDPNQRSAHFLVAKLKDLI
jgi:hypothetical protein